VEDASFDWIADCVTIAIANGTSSPSAVLFLLRKYSASDRDDVRQAIERGLTHGLDAVAGDSDPRRRCQWLCVFAEAAAVSDDERLVATVQSGLASAIDGLERLVRSSYEPGEGVIGAELHDQLLSALAFLTAFELTGRLPYSMLAEELLQTARRLWWNEERGEFVGSFAANAVAAQILCRLAALHRDPDYAASAVVAPHASYADDAARIVASLEPVAREHVSEIAEYGMALADWFALRELPN
jgi:uncharacterized protein YyaL (SSP411 family)